MDYEQGTLRYDRWIEDALKSVVRRALNYCQENGLPGDHHFYITFATDHPDVTLPDHLREQYPKEITVVLENEFWDLDVHDTGFDVTLSFSDVKTRVKVPFDAVSGFADPAVKFGLQFKMEVVDEEDELDEIEGVHEPAAEQDGRANKSSGKTDPDGDGDEPDGNGGNVIALDTFRKK